MEPLVVGLVTSKALTASAIHISSWSYLGAGDTETALPTLQHCRKGWNPPQTAVYATFSGCICHLRCPSSCPDLSWRTPPADRGLSARPMKHMSPGSAPERSHHSTLSLHGLQRSDSTFQESHDGLGGVENSAAGRMKGSSSAGAPRGTSCRCTGELMHLHPI